MAISIIKTIKNIIEIGFGSFGYDVLVWDDKEFPSFTNY